MASALVSASVVADEAPPRELLAVHGQLTGVLQAYPGFAAAHAGAHSLPAGGGAPTSLSTSLFFGLRLWAGAELYVDPEDEGRDSDGAAPQGLGAYPNIERFHTPAPRVFNDFAPIFLRQTFDLGGGSEAVAPGANRLAGVVARRRVTFTLGRFALPALFDHVAGVQDADEHFLNAAIVNGAAFDYAADELGYTWALAAEWTDGVRTLRSAFALEPSAPRSLGFAWDIGRAHGLVAEAQTRFWYGTRPGAARLLAFVNNAPMGLYDLAPAHTRHFSRPVRTFRQSMNLRIQELFAIGLWKLN